MSVTLNRGPNGTAVGGLATITKTFAPLNFDADFRITEEGPSKAVMVDVTAPVDRPATLRIAQTVRPNVYSGTGLGENVMLPSRKGLDTIIEAREVWSAQDTLYPDQTFFLPFRVAITINAPMSAYVTADAVEAGIERCLAGIYAQGDGDMTAGLNAILHGIAKK